MADRQFWNAGSNIPYARELNFRFFPDAANQPTFVAANNMALSTVVRVSTGLYRLTLADPYLTIASALAAYQVNAPLGAGRQCLVGPINNAGTATPVTIDVYFTDAAGAVTDPPAANANNSITVQVYFKDIAAV